ncbi:MAG: hypothetical protein JNK98_02885 [Chitinophagaceae bacterium]|nr:hypothetical protein [Chitinophagaceae bacterium]
MKKTLIGFAAIFLFACNNSKKDPAPETNNQATDAPPTTTTTTPAPAAASTNSVLTIEGKELSLNGSILVDKDKKKLLAGAPYRGMITSSSGPDNEGYILRFVFDTKPGVYPVTGISFGRGKDDNAQQFGGLLGGEEKIYDSKVTLTECKDLGDNGAGGHKWSISGTVENVTIPALGIMLLDKEKNHPKEIKIDKLSFTGLTFDDNAEEMLEKAMEMLKKKN